LAGDTGCLGCGQSKTYHNPVVTLPPTNSPARNWMQRRGCIILGRGIMMRGYHGG